MKRARPIEGIALGRIWNLSMKKLALLCSVCAISVMAIHTIGSWHMLTLSVVPGGNITIKRQSTVTPIYNTPSPSAQTRQHEYHLPRGDHLYSLTDWHTSLDDIKHTGLPPSLKRFESVMDRSRSKLIRDVFFETVRLFQKHKVEYFLFGGTLLGSYRHHNMIPWDDDLDILTNVKNKDIIRRAFKTSKVFVNGKQLTLVEKEKGLWKTHSCHTRTRAEIRRKYCWPYVDIFFYLDKKHHVYPMRDRGLRWRKTKVFPLRTRPFEGTLQPVPCDVEYVLHRTYKEKVEHICMSNYYNHIKESRQPAKSMSKPCEELYPYLPFVDRVESENNITEFLKVNNTVLGHFTLNKHSCP